MSGTAALISNSDFAMRSLKTDEGRSTLSSITTGASSLACLFARAGPNCKQGSNSTPFRCLRGASRSLDAVRTASSSKNKPATTSSPRDDARRRRGGRRSTVRRRLGVFRGRRGAARGAEPPERRPGARDGVQAVPGVPRSRRTARGRAPPPLPEIRPTAARPAPNRSERPQIRKRNQPRPPLLETSRVDGVKAPPHRGTPRTCA